jgi:glycosyltransferase involved in cell wall biosynthesis
MVVHIIDELKVGGAQTHLVTMLREALTAYPHVRHRVVSLLGDGPIGEQLRAMGIGVDALDLRPYFARRRFAAAASVIREHLERYRPDVVEAHLTWSRLLGLFAAWRAGVRRRIGFEQGDIYLSSWKFRLANFLGQLPAQRIVVCSKAMADWDHRVHGLSRRRLAVMHNCVDPARFRPVTEPCGAAGFGLPAGTTTSCAVGTLGRGVTKRTDVLIRAVAIARARGAEVGLVICGDGECRGELEALTAELGAGPFVRFLGSRDDVPGVLSNCDVFCHAAPFEPFGIACVEAMASGLPVIVPDSGGIREAVEPGVTGLTYRALDVEGLADAIGFLHERPGRRREMGRAARRAAEERFSVQVYVRTLYTMYGLGEPIAAEVVR